MGINWWRRPQNYIKFVRNARREIGGRREEEELVAEECSPSLKIKYKELDV